MDDEELLRYSRQILLPEIDIEGQEHLLNAQVMLIGMGGLGSIISMYLAAAGIGTLVLVDPDHIELSNIQRQILYETKDIGRLKVDAARSRLQAINPTCNVIVHAEAFKLGSLGKDIAHADAIVDGSDNFTTRFAINAACWQSQTPLISGAAIRFEGQVSVFDFRSANNPCYRCLYSDENAIAETCGETGVIAPLLGIIGAIQALETMKLLINQGRLLTGRLLLFDGFETEWRSVSFRRDPNCPVCSTAADTRYTTDKADSSR